MNYLLILSKIISLVYISYNCINRKRKRIKDISSDLNISTSAIKKYYEDIEKEIFLENNPNYKYLNNYIKNLNKIDFFIFKTIIENPNATRNKISQLTGIGYPAICKYYPKIKKFINENI
jgi:hypothetical protein